MIQIIPAILSNDIKEVGEKLAQVDGVSGKIQIDVIDGVFANNKTVDPSALEFIETDLKLDFHLMTKEPIDWIERAVRGMADRIIGQVEMMTDQVGFVGKVSEVGLSVGLAIDLPTSISKLDPTILTNLDVVLVMSVPAGFGGQEFDRRALAKIKELDEIRIRDDTPFKICVDGGINTNNISDVVKAGADELVIGEGLFAGNIKENIDSLMKAAYKK
ncbi:hypothetical protein A2210_00800 [Candidatus Woesebacteria bacterium RIFOXYA1_FULL_40_18]|uniref:Ribulose-phosphate 3-epimerase n=1 Tax=Candidatus Woesebacteria bacterium RIFOXYA1_FULL_40_18 TaxID=1802532 RepID=A0A1F8CJF3_9BACT|nr:MAG: hypothetical protein A2210_00800 [Candidatus Woesebacteria bacterium RIFOXYA1_FULL_40_18]